MMAQRRESFRKSLSSLLDGITAVPISLDVEVQGLCLDSRKAQPGDCFIALQGAHGHGLQYLRDLSADGVCVVLSDQEGRRYVTSDREQGIPVIFVDDLREQLGSVSNRFYDYPSNRLTTIAITGTNGKTTIAAILAEVLERSQGAAGYIGTLGVGLWQNLQPSDNTTPDLLTMQQKLTEFCEENIPACTIEASSHALEQGRLDGVQTDVAVFTNLTHEHLDYHGSMDAYAKAKRRLFSGAERRCDPPANAVINLDDSYGKEILKTLDPETVGWPFGIQEESKHYPRVTTAANIEISLQGIKMRVSSPIGDGIIRSKLIGHFNVSNLLATFASLAALQWKFPDIQKALESVGGVPGRMDLLSLVGIPEEFVPAVVIDYAHSPDALEQALRSLRELTKGRLICVFGCGGDRDKDKRGLMGAIAEELSDVVMLTTDNPRTEEPAEIMRQIITGQKTPNNTLQEANREVAIRKAIAMASCEDVILVAGKGHETYQIFGRQRVPFSDYEVSRIALSERWVEGTA